MREGIGSVVLYNMIIIFIFIVFMILASALTYYKAFRVNNMILYSIDKFEGYNDKAITEINQYLDTLGYTKNTDNSTCPERDGMKALKGSTDPYYYCVYYYSNDTGGSDSGQRNGDNQPLYYNYSVVTYIYVDLPLVNKFKIPVHTKGERIFNFSDDQEQEGVEL